MISIRPLDDTTALTLPPDKTYQTSWLLLESDMGSHVAVVAVVDPKMATLEYLSPDTLLGALSMAELVEAVRTLSLLAP